MLVKKSCTFYAEYKVVRVHLKIFEISQSWFIINTVVNAPPLGQLLINDRHLIHFRVYVIDKVLIRSN